MSELRIIELAIGSIAAIATVVATFFAWRAVREGRETVRVAKETVDIGKRSLEVGERNLEALRETARIGETSLELASGNLQTLKETAATSRSSLDLASENLTLVQREHELMERDHLVTRLMRVADAVVDIHTAATEIQGHVVTGSLHLAAARARLRAALTGLPQELQHCRRLPEQGADPAGVGTILRTWNEALAEIEAAIASAVGRDYRSREK